jgi:hypothetical protein
MITDVNAFVGGYRWRRVPGTAPRDLLQAMDRTGIGEAWISHLPGIFWRDPSEGNAWLLDTARDERRFRPVPAVHPGLAGWEEVVLRAVDAGAPAVRADPTFYGIDPAGTAMRRLVGVAGEAGIALLLAVRLEDGRQRHPNDRAEELPAAAVRALVRADQRARILVTHADRSFIDEVHFGSTPDEAARIWWDISWVWGPPEDHLETLLSTVGAARFVFGTGQPLRLPETAVARLDLLDLPGATRAAIETGNTRMLAP